MRIFGASCDLGLHVVRISGPAGQLDRPGLAGLSQLQHVLTMFVFVPELLSSPASTVIESTVIFWKPRFSNGVSDAFSWFANAIAAVVSLF